MVKNEQALLVPAIAVIPTVQGRAVFVEKDGVAHQIEIEVGERTPDRIQVVRGIEPGDRVITTNLLRLRDGAPVAASTEPPP